MTISFLVRCSNYKLCVSKWPAMNKISRQYSKQLPAWFVVALLPGTNGIWVAQTFADLAGQPNIKPEHIAEAVSYRKLDRKL